MLNIKALSKVNPRDLTAAKKFYAKAISTGIVDFDRLAYLVSNQCTVRESDCYAVIRAMEHNIMDELLQGKVVQFGGLGNFQIGVSAEGQITAEEVTAATVKKPHMNFRPGKRLREMLGQVKYKVVV
jgi:predicted histone-like DNA-binding protein